MNARPWRQGGKVPQNVYAADGFPIAQFHDATTAALVVEAVNRLGADQATPPTAPEQQAKIEALAEALEPFAALSGRCGCTVVAEYGTLCWHDRARAALRLVGRLP